MKYTVTSNDYGNEIGTADTLEAAMQIVDQHICDSPCDYVNIWDENGHNVDGWFYFVGDIMDKDSTGELVLMTAEDASATLAGWQESGVEIPAGMTAEALRVIWNRLLDEDPENDELYQQCLREDDEASYQETIREAASYEPPVREEDPIIKSLQTTLDYAYNRRDDEWKAYDSLRISEKPHLGMLDSQYHSYREAQSFLEGVTMAILAAGYALTAENEGRSKVCKN